MSMAMSFSGRIRATPLGGEQFVKLHDVRTVLRWHGIGEGCIDALPKFWAMCAEINYDVDAFPCETYRLDDDDDDDDDDESDDVACSNEATTYTCEGLADVGTCSNEVPAVDENVMTPRMRCGQLSCARTPEKVRWHSHHVDVVGAVGMHAKSLFEDSLTEDATEVYDGLVCEEVSSDGDPDLAEKDFPCDDDPDLAEKNLVSQLDDCERYDGDSMEYSGRLVKSFATCPFVTGRRDNSGSSVADSSVMEVPHMTAAQTAWDGERCGHDGQHSSMPKLEMVEKDSVGTRAKDSMSYDEQTSFFDGKDTSVETVIDLFGFERMMECAAMVKGLTLEELIDSCNVNNDG